MNAARDALIVVNKVVTAATREQTSVVSAARPPPFVYIIPALVTARGRRRTLLTRKTRRKCAITALCSESLSTTLNIPCRPPPSQNILMPPCFFHFLSFLFYKYYCQHLRSVFSPRSMFKFLNFELSTIRILVIIFFKYLKCKVATVSVISIFLEFCI